MFLIIAKDNTIMKKSILLTTLIRSLLMVGCNSGGSGGGAYLKS